MNRRQCLQSHTAAVAAETAIQDSPSDFAGGALSHSEYLAEDPPRNCEHELAQKLIAALGSDGSIVVGSLFGRATPVAAGGRPLFQSPSIRGGLFGGGWRLAVSWASSKVSVPFYSGRPFRLEPRRCDPSAEQRFSPLLFGEAFSAAGHEVYTLNHFRFSPLLFGEAFSARQLLHGCRCSLAVSVPFYSGKPFRRIDGLRLQADATVSVPFYSGKPFRRLRLDKLKLDQAVSVPFYSGKPFRHAMGYLDVQEDLFQSPSIRGSLFGGRFNLSGFRHYKFQSPSIRGSLFGELRHRSGYVASAFQSPSIRGSLFGRKLVCVATPL